MTSLPTLIITPPRWSQQLLRAWLPDDPMRDAIAGDLHQELVRDAASIGADRARVRYSQRVVGIIAYVILDAVLWRPWASTTGAVATAAVAAIPLAPPVRHQRALLGRGDIGLMAAAFGVLGLGIVVNTVLFSSVRTVPSVASHGTVVTSAIGVASLVLALGSAAVAAIMLCVGPRWLRRRVCRQGAVAHDHARAALHGVPAASDAHADPQP